MYAWIWRKLPFGLYGKLAGSLLLATAAVGLLWFWVFPWAQPLLPFDDVQVGTGTGDQGPAQQDPGAPGIPGGDPESEDGHELPYSTTSNNPDPTATR